MDDMKRIGLGDSHPSVGARRWLSALLVGAALTGPSAWGQGAEGLDEVPATSSQAAATSPAEAPTVQPPDKPVDEMTPEELQAFQQWRRQQLELRQKEQAEKDTPPPGSVTFDLPFPEAKGGGSAQGWAGGIQYQQDDIAVLTDGVVIRYQEIEIKAGRLEVDLTEKLLSAFGNVVLDQGPRRLAGSTLTFDLETKTGTITDASAYLDPDFYFSGAEVRKTGENTYHVEDGIFTSCAGDVPAWSFTLGRADIEVDGYARVRHAGMRVKKAPVFYLPYIVWPVKPERTSGFLVPNVGYSDRRGAYLGLAYYKVLGQSYDTTFHLDLYSKEYIGVGNEFRYQPTEGTKGKWQIYAIDDPVDNEWRWKLDLDHQTTDLPFGMRGVLTVREFSDFEFFRDFERSVDRNTIRSLESRGFITGNWGPHSLNILLNNRETFLSGGRSVVLQRLPEIEYELRPTKLGNLPLFLKVQSSLNYLSMDRSETLDGRYGRADLAPQLILPVKLAPWLSMSFAAGYRSTWYSDTVGPNADNVEAFTGESLNRGFSFASASFVGPSFSRIYDKTSGRYSKLKHVIEPRWDYSFVEDIDDGNRIPLFDEIDRINSNNVGRFALVNRLLAKPRPKEGEQEAAGGAREILSWELSRAYSFDDARPLQSGRFENLPGGVDDGMGDGTVERQAGPVSSLLRFNPSNQTNLTARVDYDTLFGQITSTSLSGSVGLGRNSLGLSWRTNWDNETGEKRSDQARIGASLDLVPRRLNLKTDLVYDIEKSLLQQQRYLLNYLGQCASFTLEWRESEFGTEVERDLRFSLTLKNVGTFLDLTN
ncbi:MAG: LPS-assembly protein LptD [Acidobacteria bacterium]|nr:LPS-assembly protein LptD [Acidobacteriota bacterium]